MSFHSALYCGELVHARQDELARRAFRYGVYVAALDLDELPVLDRQLRLFSLRGRNLFGFDDRDYAATLSPARREHGDLTSSLAALREANGLPAPHATRLVTNLRTLGYVFNPVSFFIDYDARGTVTSVIAEVNNTYGGRLRYVLGPAQRLPGPRVGFRHVRELYVSPFLHGAATYDFWFDAPRDGRDLTIEVHVQRADRRIFTARLTGRRAPLSDVTLLFTALRYPLLSVRVISLIHFEALRLRFAGVPYRRPARDHRPLSVRPR